MRLQEYRLKENKTVIQCAKELKVTDTTIRRWESGSRRPTRTADIKRLIDWSNGAVQPNDFYLTTETDEA